MEKIYAIIRHGGKQYKVTEGATIKIDKVEAKAGDVFTFSDVLSVIKGGSIEKLKDKGSSVKGKVIGQIKDKKVIIFKKRRTKGYTKKQGHRQVRSEILIESIN
jgi:large subunit ribosomal protein L21